MSDAETTVQTLKSMVDLFVSERDWHQFHSPKNLSMSLAIEAAELMEHFQWLTTESSREIVDDAEKWEQVGEELADVLCYALGMANELGIDVATALANKMEKNRLKYPVAKCRGRFGKDDPSEVSPPSDFANEKS